MFGTLNGDLADRLSDEICKALAEGVSTLPLLGEASSGSGGEDTTSSRAQVLLRKLQRAYNRNVDLFELYCARNVFTVSMYPPRRRKEIVDAFLKEQQQEQQGGDDDDDVVMEDAASAAEGGAEDQKQADREGSLAAGEQEKDGLLHRNLLPRSRKEIPAPHQLRDLEEELQQLRRDLEEKRRLRVAADQRLRQMIVASDLAEKSRSKVVGDETGGSAASASSTAATRSIVDSLEGLEQSLAHSQDLLQHMNALKQRRADSRLRRQREKRDGGSGDGGDILSEEDEDDTMEVAAFPGAAAAANSEQQQHAAGLDERYERDRRNLLVGGSSAGGSRSGNNLDSVYKMLVAGKDGTADSSSNAATTSTNKENVE